MVEVNAGLELTGPDGSVTLLDAFEGRRQRIAWHYSSHAPPTREHAGAMRAAAADGDMGQWFWDALVTGPVGSNGSSGAEIDPAAGAPVAVAAAARKQPDPSD